MKRTHSVLTTGLALITLCIVMCFGNALAASVRSEGVRRETLPKELRNVTIRNAFVPHTGKAAGVFNTVVGNVVVLHEDMRQAYYAAAGDRLYEKDVVYTLKNSRCRIRLYSEDVITMGEHTRIGVTSLSDNRKTQEKKSEFDMTSGKALFYTLRLFKHKGASMTVKTPTAVIGVRGTKFGVDVNAPEEKSHASRSVQIADSSEGGFRYLAQSGPGPIGSTTTVIVFEGTVGVTSTAPVPPPPPGVPTPPPPPQTILVGGQMTTVATGVATPPPPVPTPPAVSNAFVAETYVPSSGGTLPPGAPPPPASPPPSSPSSSPGNTSPLTPAPPDTSSVSQQQATKIVEDTNSKPTLHYGYFAGMLSKDDGSGSVIFKYHSVPSTRHNFDVEGAVTGTDPFVGGHEVKVDGTGEYKKPIITWLYADGYGATQSVKLQDSIIGSNSYMEWGSWTQPTAMVIAGAGTYYYNNSGYYIMGDSTTDAQMAVLKANSISAAYSGYAYGTFWTPDGGVNMTGTFSADVNFTAPNISNFNVSVSGGNKSVSISGANGAFDGSSSHFTITPGTGTWTITDGAGTSTCTRKSAIGSIYGSSGQAIGGVWQADDAGYKHATGIFRGAK